MPEPIDVILPILPGIQADLADLKRDLLATKEDLGDKMDALTGRMDEFEGYFTYTMGLTNQHKLAITRVRSEVAGLSLRLDELEKQP